MNGLANWGRIIKGLSTCAVVVFLLILLATQKPIYLPQLSSSSLTIKELGTAYKSISTPLGTALTVTGVLFWVFTKWLWRLPLFRKMGVINYPCLSGTWYATSFPGEWDRFTTVVAIDHSFNGIRVTLIRNQSLGRSLVATLERTTDKSVRLYVVYYSQFGEQRSISEIPAVDRSEDHSGTLSLDLNDEINGPAGWVLKGEYWTNKRKNPHDDASKGTWGRIAMEFKRRDLAPSAVGQLVQEDKAWLQRQEPANVSR